jgi:hypothetical protein
MIPSESAVNLLLTVLAESSKLSPDAFKTKHGYEKPRTENVAASNILLP